MVCGPPQRLSKWNSIQGQKKLFLSKLSQVFCKHNTKLTYILILGLAPFLNWASLEFLPSYWDLQKSSNSSSSNSPVSSIHWSLSCTSSNGTFASNTHWAGKMLSTWYRFLHSSLPTEQILSLWQYHHTGTQWHWRIQSAWVCSYLKHPRGRHLLLVYPSSCLQFNHHNNLHWTWTGCGLGTLRTKWTLTTLSRRPNHLVLFCITVLAVATRPSENHNYRPIRAPH